MNQNSQTIKPMMIFILESTHQVKLLEKWSNSSIKCSGELHSNSQGFYVREDPFKCRLSQGSSRNYIFFFFFLCSLEIFIKKNSLYFQGTFGCLRVPWGPKNFLRFLIGFLIWFLRVPQSCFQGFSQGSELAF